MKRKCKFLINSNDGKKAIYIDDEIFNEIISYIQQDDRHKKKFKFIADLILNGLKNTSHYDK